MFFLLKIYSGAARKTGPDSMLILCEFVSEFVSLCEIISRPLIGRKLGIPRDVARRRTT